MTERWNILLITADDLGAETPGAFGGPEGIMPALDAFAATAMRFDRAHVAAAVCQPSRSAMLTGLWPHRNGAEGFEPIADGVPVLTDHLRAAGYRVGILGKVDHLQPVERFGWDRRAGMRELGLGRDPARYAAETASFLAEGDGPWFLMVNAHDPHRPFSGSAAEAAKWDEPERAAIPDPSRRFAAGENPVPPFLPDLPDVRTEWAEYLSSARRCDDVLAAVLGELTAAGAEETTLVVFLSDNGVALPFAKANCYLQSTRTPLLVRWPGRTRAGQVEHDRFVSALDLFPTFCEAAGIPIPDGLDGHSLVPLVDGAHAEPREAVVTVFHETSAKRRFEMRCVQDARYGYIWNAWSDGATEYAAENMEGLTWPAMLAAADVDPALAARADFYRLRAVEEFYDLVEDPAASAPLPAEHPRLAEYRARLGAWMDETSDPLAERYRREILAVGV